MYLLTVIPISRGVGKDSLTYFAKTNPPIDSLISIPLRKKSGFGLVVESKKALDSKSEKLVQEGIKNLIRGRTTIIIAHRFSTVREADKIIVLENGKVAEEGNHEQLMKKRGLTKHF